MGRKMRVLFVDDSSTDVELECRQLLREHVDFEWRAVDSEEGLRQAIREFRPDVVLSDFSMPGFSGLEALQIMKSSAPEIPLIFVSGTIGEEMAVSCLRDGATDYILKGNLNRLGSSVQRAVSQFEQSARVRSAEEIHARLAEILEATPDIVATADASGRLIYMNEAGRRILGLAEDDVAGAPAGDFYTEQSKDILRKEAIPAAMEKGAWQGETLLRTRGGLEIPVSQVIVAHNAADGRAQYVSGIARDVRERKTFEARIYHLAHHDLMTGLPNRSMLGDRVTQALVHARRSGRTAALLGIHIDNFNLVNDGFGHEAGERMLAEIGERLRGAVREGDTVARTGADEFSVLLADLARLDDAHAVARKILDLLMPPIAVGGQDLRISTSVGAAIYPNDGDDFETLLRNAVAAMRRAAAQDRGGFQYYAAEMTRDSLERFDIETRMQSALDRREFTLHYQPQYDIQTRRALGVEALMRWVTAEGVAVSPVRFIPVAEETGMIRLLGEWVLAETCNAVLLWAKAGNPQVRAAVNVSPRQLSSDVFVEAVGRVLSNTGFPPALLELEITESALMGSGSAPLETLNALKALGVKIAIDDFGTGYSSLSYLSRLPIDRLKVDRSFVQRMTADRRDAAIVHTIVALGHGLGFSVVAEGVETEEQLAMLAAMGCDEAQGYLLARPAPGEQVREMLFQGP